MKKKMFLNVIANLMTDCSICKEPSLGGFDSDRDLLKQEEDNSFEPEQYFIKTTCISCHHVEEFYADSSDMQIELRPRLPRVVSEKRIEQ